MRRTLAYSLFFALVMAVSDMTTEIVLAAGRTPTPVPTSGPMPVTTAHPAPVPTPIPVPPGHTLRGDLGDLVAMTGIYGTLTWAASAIAFKLYELKTGKDLENDVKIWVSAGIGVGVATAAYLLGGLFGYWAISPDGAYDVLWRSGQAVLGSKIIFAATTGIERKNGARPSSVGR
jgi:hypothetical protein